MGLTAAEKQAGRVFKSDQQQALNDLNAKEPPNFVVPFFLGLFRHLCSARNNRSTAIELREHYVRSPIYPGEVVVQPGRFGFLYREGRCRGCGSTARSEIGRLVDGHLRPPLTGRTARS